MNAPAPAPRRLAINGDYVVVNEGAAHAHGLGIRFTAAASPNMSNYDSAANKVLSEVILTRPAAVALMTDIARAFNLKLLATGADEKPTPSNLREI